VVYDKSGKVVIITRDKRAAEYFVNGKRSIRPQLKRQD